MIYKNWNKQTTLILKAHLVEKSMRYHDLAIALKEMGIQESQSTIASKLCRGTFSFAFFLQCMHALEVKQIDLNHELYMDITLGCDF